MGEIVNAVPENSERKQRNPYLFKPGQSGNPAGKPKGSRNRLNEEFLAALATDFKLHGEVAICRVREERPQDYLKVIASILPKQIEIKDDVLDGLDDDRLLQLIGALERSVIHASGAGQGAEEIRAETGPESVSNLPAVQETG